MSSALRLVWSWRARAIASIFAAGTAALAVWAAYDPRSDAWVTVATALLATVCTLAAVETHVFRVDADSEGLRRRSLCGTDTLAWTAIQAVRLVDTRHEGMAIVHARTTNLGAAFHVRLVTAGRSLKTAPGPCEAPRPVREESRTGPNSATSCPKGHADSGRPGPFQRPAGEGGRPWKFNRWMDGFDDLLGIVAERGWPRLTDPPAPDSPLLEWVLWILRRFIELGREIVAGFVLLFSLFFASTYIVAAGAEPTRNFGLDLLIVALALLAAASLVGSLVRKLGARRLLRDDPSRADWMMSTAGLIFGTLVLVLFVPEALAGDRGAWLLIGLGALGLLGGLLR
ncbi:PH domain-containing protein [Nannocystis punicea]|uniref:PH domain-containing protein n=1 Tax=Nannocystis punicea TaxID=2995304 RepID=A0ABY7H6K1_9BACT|nr:PH domain-containing protein [Nannocystis poenicansa]WAS94901.1 PH domain-containing protein [Nannocystis poenicansa]